MKLKVKLIDKQEQSIYGVWTRSNDKTISKDIPLLTTKYYSIVNKNEKEVLPFFVLSKDYDEITNNFNLFIGGTIPNKELETFSLPESKYAIITVKPKLGFIWPLAIGEAKKYFYTSWLPNSAYKPSNIEFEHHTEKSISKKPTIEIYFAVKQK